MGLSRTSTHSAARLASKDEIPPKHPTNKKPYPHSPPGIVTTTSGDVIQLTYDSLDIEGALKEVNSKWAGATSLFLGSTREDWTALSGNSSDHRYLRVTRLEYESYTPLALKTLRAIVRKARDTPLNEWPPAELTPKEIERLDAVTELELSEVELKAGTGKKAGGSLSKRYSRRIGDKDIRKSLALREPDEAPNSPNSILHIHVSHRLGPVPVGTPSILLAVSSPHRRRAFEVSEWLLEEIKRRVPIWKREIREPFSMRENGKVGDRRKGEGKARPLLERQESEWIGLNDRQPAKVPTASTIASNGAGLDDGESLSRFRSEGGEDVFSDATFALSMSRLQ